MLSSVQENDRKQKWSQVRTQINVEYEHVKDISAVLASFKMSDPVPSARAPGPRDDFILPQDDNGYDPDVWPPPTPVENNRNRAPVHRDVRQNKRNDPPPRRGGFNWNFACLS